MTDVIMGSITGLTWPQIRPYAVSLSLCGFEGEKVLFVNKIDSAARQKLQALNFNLIDFELPPEFEGRSCDSQTDVAAWTAFGYARYQPAIEFLKSRNDLRYVVWADVRDVIFQTDPMEWIASHIGDKPIITAREGWTIENQPHNAAWMQYTAPEDWDEMRTEEVLCAGTVAGTADGIRRLFERISEKLQTVDPRANDQGIFNWVLRQETFDEDYWIPRLCLGFVVTGWPHKIFLPYAYSTDDRPVFNASDYVAYTPDGETPFCIVHQYDRDTQWRRAIEAIMETTEQSLLKGI